MIYSNFIVIVRFRLQCLKWYAMKDAKIDATEARATTAAVTRNVSADAKDRRKATVLLARS